MKKFSSLFLAGSLATALFLGYGLAKAQDAPAADDQGGDHPAMQGDQGKDADGGKDRIEHMKDKLGLTDDQAAKIKEAFMKQKEAIKPLRDQEKIDMDTLQQKVDSKASDADIKALLDKLKADHKLVMDTQERSMDKIRTILNPTQQAQMVLMMMRGPMGQGWGGMKKGDWKKHKGGKEDDTANPAPAADEAPADK